MNKIYYLLITASSKSLIQIVRMVSFKYKNTGRKSYFGSLNSSADIYKQKESERTSVGGDKLTDSWVDRQNGGQASESDKADI